MLQDFRKYAGEINRELDADEAEENQSQLLDCFKPLTDFTEEEATWLVPGWLPEGQITLLAADGGVGKVNLVAALSSGSRCLLDPPDFVRTPSKVSFLTTEDSVRKKLVKKLRLAGAEKHNIYAPDFLADSAGILRGLKFGSPLMAQYIKATRHRLYVFDPVQGFIPPEINMGSRNAMRDCLAPLISLGEETGSSFLIVCHTNKRKGASGRDRIADSADLWDISRSVLMAGYTEDQGIRYLSNEKNNYSERQMTVLFSIDDNGQIVKEGESWKRDYEYQMEAKENAGMPKRDDCKKWMLQQIEFVGGSMEVKVLEDLAKENGYGFKTIKKAKSELKDQGKIKFRRVGFGKDDIKWFVELLQLSEPDGIPF